MPDPVIELARKLTPEETHSPEDRRAVYEDLLELQRPLRERLESLADELASFNCEEDEVPAVIDVPDDYESGLHEAARRIQEALRV